MSEEILIVNHITKKYRLGMIGGTTLRDELQRRRAARKGLEDPTRKVDDKSVGRIGEEFLALNDVTFTVNQGERIGIIGHNGAGKSTLLKLISQITAPSKGTIEMNGRIASMLEVGTGFHPELTGRENIYMNGAILGMSKAEIDSKIENIIEFSECRQFIDTPVKRYSSGMYVKLAFSVAAHLDSEIMIMDEVLAVGDINFQQKCLKKMREAAVQDGRTILYVSHNMSTIKSLCNRCIVLDKGEVVFNGDVDEAIGIYSNKNKMEKRNIYDVSRVKRGGGLIGDHFLTGIKCEKTELDIGENLVFDLDIQSKVDTPNALLRFVLLNRIGEAVSMTYSNKYQLNKGKNTIRFSLPTNELVHGDYYVDLVLCDYDGVIQNRQDAVERSLAFSINENHLYNTEWNTYAWGYIKINDIEANRI